MLGTEVVDATESMHPAWRSLTGSVLVGLTSDSKSDATVSSPTLYSLSSRDTEPHFRQWTWVQEPFRVVLGLLTIVGPIVLYIVGPRIGRPRLLAHVGLAAVVALGSLFLGELLIVAIALAMKVESSVADLVAKVGGVLVAVAAIWLTFRRRRFGRVSPRPKTPSRRRHHLPQADKKVLETARTCARCQGALAWFRKNKGVENSLPRAAVRFCTTCGALMIEPTQRLSSPWRFRVPEQGRFEARTPPASDLRQGFRRLGVFLDVVLVLAALGQLSNNPAGAGKTLGATFFLWLVTPGRARDILVAVKQASRREDLLIEDTLSGPLTLDSRGIAELWVRARAEEYGSQFELVATLREKSEILTLVPNLTATDATNLAEHLAACLDIPAPTRLLSPPQPST
jgi:hypothetical protein